MYSNIFVKVQFGYVLVLGFVLSPEGRSMHDVIKDEACVSDLEPEMKVYRLTDTSGDR